jgi:tRNA (adenine37-N6)-methyltransferase
MEKSRFILQPIGRTRAGENRFWLEIDAPFRAGLDKLDNFGHVIALWWAHERDNEADRKTTVTEIPYAGNMPAGVFACRAEYRPNPIAVTVCQILSVDAKAGTVTVPYMDAFDGSPLLDLKAYFPVSDRVRECRVPDWVKDWPEWFEDAYKLEALFAKLFAR